MKFKILIIILILFCYPLISQEKSQDLRVITWEQIHGLDYTILYNLLVNGKQADVQKCILMK